VAEVATVTGPDGTGGSSGSGRGGLHLDASKVARGAMIIAGLTILSRILGLVRTLVFSQTLGATCLGSAYITANQVPNLVYELVLGGALTSAMVPVLARLAERSAADEGAKAEIGQICSAVLTWSAITLVPIAVIIGFAASPVASLLNPANPNADCVHAQVVAATAGMLRVFAPQVLLYGLSVVLFGLLQAYRRFAGYALAPVVANVVLISSYLAFAQLDKGLPLSRLSDTAQLVLAGGATLSVAILVRVPLVPTLRLRLRLRPAVRLPAGVARRVGGLAAIGVAEFLASDLSSVAVIALANGRGETGALVLYNYSFEVYNSLHSVLALSIVVSAFPLLSARQGADLDRACAGSTRAVLLVACLGVACVAAVALPAAHVLAKTPDQVPELVEGFALYAPGLPALGLIANLSRMLMVVGRLWAAGIALAGTYLLITVLQVGLGALARPHEVVGALALGSAAGTIAAAIPLLIYTRRVCGPAAVRGAGRATFAGLTAACVGTAAGVGVATALPYTSRVLAAGAGAAAVGVALVAFVVVALLLDGPSMRPMLGALLRARRSRPAR
jgi:putative peptidoglycan lipid II flippase